MTPADERSLAHARAVRARGAAMPPEGVPPAILDSWVRCARAQLDFAAPPPPMVVDAGELARRRQRVDPVRRLALAEIETLLPQIAGSNFLLAFADQEGVILDLFSDNRFQMNASDAAIVAGSCWSEALCGTNGLGTALATGRSIAVNGLEHFFVKHGDISCAASPIRDSQGQVVGVLDASSYVGSRQQHTQALVQMAATHVENLLLTLQMRGHLVIAVHPRPEFLATLSCGLIAFDAEGRVSAFNARAQGLLTGLMLRRGTPFEDVFDDTFDRFTAHAAVDAEMRLRDVLGSALVARCVRAPLAPSPHRLLAPAPASAAAPRQRSPTTRPGTVAGERMPRTPQMIADDPAVAEALRMAEAAVRLRVPLLILGETGTGKELLAQHAHTSGDRGGAFVAVNCGALPAELFEAELFGYAGGSFTGARREGSAGLIEAAHRGTLLLDEIGELPLSLQGALLRFLDDQQVRPVGGTHSRRVDVQLLAATHCDLEADVATRRFRADLWHRLNVVTLRLPPLRERSDFAALARSVLSAIEPSARLDDAALARLSSHPWRGNMRELRAVLTRALLMHSTGQLKAADFEALLPLQAAASGGAHSVLQHTAMQRVLSEFERTGRSVSQTSRNLDISRTTVYRYLRESGVRPKRADPPTMAARVC
jgi:sigma-54 dependent transcriptional regulator, acetoin dehydrogenase operon transcriptional activator AcoR